jgi:GNAT superfamily N-acetyltransferase
VIREATIEDAAGAATLRALVNPELVVTAEAYAYRMRTVPPSSRRAWWCAEADGEIVGWATAGLVVETSEVGVAQVDLDVHPVRCRRGIGSALLARVEEHAVSLGARRLFAWSRADDPTVAFATAHGFEETSRSQMMVIDPRTVDPPSPPPEVELRPFADFADDPSQIFALDVTTVLDEPAEVRLDDIPYDIWLERWWGQPLVDREASVVTLLDRKPVSLTWLLTDREHGRGSNNGTGTLPDYRGRGLARLAKRESLARAAALGLTAVYTGNDISNAPMLAINRSLGYQPCSTMCTWAKELPGGATTELSA